jgi:predicted ATPase
MPLRVIVENYRCLAQADWTLQTGVSLLVGPNGSGKTTLLEVPALLSDAIAKGTRTAVDEHGGPGTIVNLKVATAEYARIRAAVDDCSWEVELRPRGGDMTIAHRIVKGGKQIAEVPTTYPLFDGRFVSIGAVQAAGGLYPITQAPSFQLVEPGEESSPDMKSLVDHAPQVVDALAKGILGYLLHGGYWVRSLRVNGSRVSSDVRLDRDGTNAFVVLRNWRDARAMRPRWDFVLSGLKDAFPESFDDIEFESAGQAVAARFFAPRVSKSVGAYFAPDGLLTGLLHLTAVASTFDGGAVAIDEFENSLHPYAIRALLEHIRTWASAHSISVSLATHSPVLIDQFKDQPDRLLVMDPASPVVPVAISKMRDPEWLAHFSLGDLYASGEFGAQAPH